jgi:macrolide-specific efflux system membrane fusion protein
LKIKNQKGMKVRPIKLTRQAMIKVALIGSVVGLLLGVGVWKWTRTEKPVYLTSPVLRADLENAVLATGVLQGVKQVDVGAQVSGQLKSLKVEVGDQVKKGQWLAEIDPVILKNELLVAQATQDNLQAQHIAAQAKLEEATATFGRQQALLPHQATSPQEYDLAKKHLHTQRAEVKALQAQIRQAKVNVASALANLAYTRILAPIAGEVVNITTLEGQTVIATQAAPTILKLADLSTITVKAQVSEADVIRIYTGQPVYFTILGEPDKKYYSKLRQIQPSPEEINKAMFFNALFDVPNPTRKLRLNMTAQVSIILDHIQQALVIPTMALGDKVKDGRYTVRVLNPDGSVSVRFIKIGVNNNVQVQVLEGLKEKENVITSQAAIQGADA